MIRITIFTPTYNRGYILSRCYDSLCNQTNKEFQWLIVDDGSTDNTEVIVNSWIKESKISIKYIKQSNGGKHVAHNTAVNACGTEIFVCVDSDDFLVEDAIDVIYGNWEQVENDDDLAGIIALKGFSKTKVVGKRMPNGIIKTSIFELYDKYKFKGDTILIFKTNILKHYLFPVFENEKFVTEAAIYDIISQNYKMILVDKILYLCEYLNDGYSKNLLSVHRKNTKGYMFYLSQRVEFANNLYSKYRACAYYVSGCIRVRRLNYLRSCKYRFLCIIALPKAVMIFVKPFIKSWLLKTKIMNN